MNIMKNEIWRDIKGYEGLYQISNLGRVKSLGRKSYSNVCLKDKILNPALECKNGYKRVCLCKDGKEKRIKVHRLVAQAFIPNPDNKPIINHKDGNKLNNSVDNLEWISRSDNVKHAYQIGLNRPSGGGHNKKAIRIVETGEVYISQEDCAKAINGSTAGVSMVINGKRKTNIYKGYHLEQI